MDTLTGKAFVPLTLFEKADEPVFQLEAIIGGNFSRLQASGKLPVVCVYGRGHNLQIKRTLESMPPQYEVGCSCGYSTIMQDVNEKFNEYK